MKNTVFALSKLILNSQNTELNYYIASARADKADLVSFVYAEGMTEETKAKLMQNVSKSLRRIRAQGRLDFFVSGNDFNESSTEAQYVLNKFPEYMEFYKNTDLMFCVML
jgi:hypothetical protein